jgi:2-keto-4-pentenoate hydratase/2-oxohepta-3-ene-1,7-dioic acid hydratase in catechol pathway
MHARFRHRTSGCRGRFLLGAALALTAAAAPAHASTAECLESAELIRIARVVGPDGDIAYGRVLESESGVPTGVVPIAAEGAPLATVFERSERPLPANAPIWRIPLSERADRICAPAPIASAALRAETAVIVAAGLNYAAHADEAGGGEVFLFPKPAAPGAPYGAVSPSSEVRLLDYEVELAFVLLKDVDLDALPDLQTFLEQSAFFVANDLTDREALIRRIGFSPPGIGFVEAKGQPGFLPTGPWMVRGDRLFAALAECGAPGLSIGLEVDEGGGFVARQNATTDHMIVRPYALIRKIAEQITEHGLRTHMPMEEEGDTRYYPFAVQTDPATRPRLPAGTIVLTGTPEGVAFRAPEIAPLLFRGLARLRSPTEQLRLDEIERAKSGEPRGYLSDGDQVRAHIDGLGTQTFTIRAAGVPVQHDPCLQPERKAADAPH